MVHSRASATGLSAQAALQAHQSQGWVLTHSNALDSSGDNGCAEAGVDARKDGGNEVLAAQDAEDARARIEAHQRPCQNAGQCAGRHNVPSPWQPCALYNRTTGSQGQAQEMALKNMLENSPSPAALLVQQSVEGAEGSAHALCGYPCAYTAAHIRAVQPRLVCSKLGACKAVPECHISHHHHSSLWSHYNLCRTRDW